MNWIDHAVGYVSPRAGLRRLRVRAAMEALRRGYEGAQGGRRTDGWRTSGTAANAEVSAALPRLRDRARDLVRNNPYAAKGVAALVSNLVGTGIVARARVRLPEASSEETSQLNTEVDGQWARFVAECDADGRTDFHGLQALAARAVVESGEALVRLRLRPRGAGLAVPLQLQVLEADHLDASRTGELAGGGFVHQGIEFDGLGRRVAYWLYPVHPGEVASFRRLRLESRRVPAASVCHLFERLRPGQARGVPWLAPVILRLRDLDEYDDAELVRKKIEACFAAFVLDADETEPLGATRQEASGRRIESFEPGMIEYLPAGRDVRFAAPATSGGYPEYMRLQLHAVAAGLGLTYELLTGDLSQVNYSSIRAGLIEFRRRIEALQWQVLIPCLCQPVWQRFVAVAQAAGTLPPGEIGAEWTAPRFEAVDPLKDAKADIMAVRAGFMPLREAIARNGYDPGDVLAEIATTNALIDRLGLVLDTDPRRATQSGQAKDPTATTEEKDDDEDV
ncbi:MAG: phage portal protein [Alphaproteobacteria bacterium]